MGFGRGGYLLPVFAMEEGSLPRASCGVAGVTTHGLGILWLPKGLF